MYGLKIRDIDLMYGLKNYSYCCLKDIVRRVGVKTRRSVSTVIQARSNAGMDTGGRW